MTCAWTVAKPATSSGGGRARRLALFASGMAIASTLGADLARAETAEVAADGFSEVVVTARKRVETVQDVAASVTVEQGEVLQARNLAQLTEYAANVPGLNVANLGKAGLSAISLRGVASVSAGASVAAYVDETPMGSSSLFNYGANTILDLLPYDLDRLEVIRGPQGTLYGAGALGGLVKYVLKPADVSGFGAALGADAETTDGAGKLGHSVRGMINIPVVSDQLAVRISGYDRQQPGYIDNVWPGAAAQDVNTESQRGGRVALLWQATPALTIKGDFYRTEIDAADSAVVSFAEAVTGTATDARIVAFARPFGRLQQNHAFPQRLKKDITLYAATLNWNGDFATITSATSYAEQRLKITADQSLATRPFGFLFGVPGALARSETSISLNKFTQEIRISDAGTGSSLQWVFGAFFTDEQARQGMPELGDSLALYRPDFTLAPGLNPFLTTGLDTEYKEYAAFGDLTWRLAEAFDVSGGVRLARNEQTWVQDSGGIFAGPSAGTLKAEVNAETIATWSTAARYRVSPDVMVFGRVATGYRPGGPNAPTPGAPLSVRSDSLINYELGVKSQFSNDTVLVNATVFAVDWNDVQLNAVRSGFSYLSNGGEARSRGLELTTSWLPTPGLVLSANFAYTKSELKAVIAEASFVKGYQLPGVPKVAGSLNADYEWSPAQGWSAAVGGNWRYVGEQWLTGVQNGPSAAPTAKADAYQLLNLHASATRGNVSFKLFINNVTNELAQQGGIALIDLGNSFAQGDIYIAKPRTVGVGVDFKFR